MISALRPHGLAVRTPAFHAGDHRFESGWGYLSNCLLFVWFRTPAPASVAFAARRVERFWKQTGQRCAAADGRLVKPGGRHSLLYELYIGSPLWRVRRWWWFVTRDRRCARCRRRLVLHGGGSATVTVHHRTDARLGRERRADVELLCWRCHRSVDWWRHRPPAAGGSSGMYVAP